MVGSHATPSCQHVADRARQGLVGKPALDIPRAAERMQGGGGHPPRLARGPVAARRRQRRQMAEPLEAVAVDAEQFAAPGRAVGTEPETVKRKPEQRPFDTMLGRKRGDMRMMVLHGYHGQPEPMGELRAWKIGMQIAGNRHRLDLED